MTNAIDLRKHLLGIGIILGALIWLGNVTAPTYNVKEVDIATAKTLIDGGALVVDVRGKDAHAGRHIAGSIQAKPEELRAAIPERIRALAADAPIVVYCGDGLSIGPEGTDILNKAGYAGAVNLKGGIEGWAAAGYPIGKI